MPVAAGNVAIELIIVKLKSDKAKYEEELKKRKADEELNKDVCEELNSFERSNTPSPAKFLLDRYTERKDNEITPQEKELKKAEKETEKANCKWRAEEIVVEVERSASRAGLSLGTCVHADGYC